MTHAQYAAHNSTHIHDAHTANNASRAHPTSHPAHIAPSDPRAVLDPKVMRPWKRPDVIISTICLNLFAVVLPILILQMYDRIIPNQAMGTLSIMAVGVGIAVLLESILRVARSYILGWISQQFEYTTTSNAFSRLVHSNLGGLNQMGVGQHIENIESLAILKEFYAGQNLLIFLDLPFLFLFLGLINYFGGFQMMLICLVVLSVFAASSVYLGHELHHTLQKRQQIGDRKYSFLIELLSNYYTLKSLNMEELFLRRFERIQLQVSYIDYKINLYSSEARYLGSLFSSILFGSIIYVAGSEVIQNVISAGAMAACLFLSNRIMQPIQQCLSVWTRFQHFKIAQNRFDSVLKLPIEHDHGIKPDIIGGITFQNVSFSYEHSDRILYNTTSFSINPGDFVTIVGRNGVGKTTLSQLMMGNIDPQDGQVFVDGVDLRTMNMPHFRKHVAYLSPQGEIFNGSIMDNLTLFNPDNQNEKARVLCRKVGLENWIQHLSHGYDTIIGNNMDGDLPLGIQQRLCFVRALLIAPQILILDEANTNLDITGDHDMMKVLLELKGFMTIVFITHRPSVSRISDRVFEIKDNRVVERFSA